MTVKWGSTRDLDAPDGRRQPVDSFIQSGSGARRAPGAAARGGRFDPTISAALDTSGFSGSCELADGHSSSVHADWVVADSAVTGTLSTTTERTAA